MLKFKRKFRRQRVKSAQLLLEECTIRRRLNERSTLFERSERWRLFLFPSTFSHLVAFPQFFYLKTLLLYNLTAFLYMFICASFMNDLKPHKKTGNVECSRDNVWEGTWKQVVVVLLETLCRRLGGRTEKNYAEISEDNLCPELVSKQHLLSTRQKRYFLL